MSEDEVAVDVVIEDEEVAVDVQVDSVLKGDKGDDGYTPVKGVDYYTDEEKEAFQEEIFEAVSKYTEQIDKNTTDIADIKEEQETQNTNISDLQDKVSAIEEEQTTQNEDISELKETVSTLKEDTLAEILYSEGYTTVEEGATIVNGLEITLPVSYYVGSGTLELYWNGHRLVQKTDDNDDGHYVEVGEAGELSSVIQMYRTDNDGKYTLLDNAVIHEVVKGKKVSA